MADPSGSGLSASVASAALLAHSASLRIDRRQLMPPSLPHMEVDPRTREDSQTIDSDKMNALQAVVLGAGEGAPGASVLLADMSAEAEALRAAGSRRVCNDSQHGWGSYVLLKYRGPRRPPSCCLLAGSPSPPPVDSARHAILSRLRCLADQRGDRTTAGTATADAVIASVLTGQEGEAWRGS